MRPALLALLTLCLSSAARAAEPLTVEQLARVRVDEAAALARVDAAHGHRKPSEMSSEERRQVIAEQEAASREVLQRHGVDEKTYARQGARLSRAQQAEVEAAERALRARQAAPPAPRPAVAEIEVEYGTAVSLEPPREDSGPEAIQVDYGTPIPLEPAEDGQAPAGDVLPAGN